MTAPAASIDTGSRNIALLAGIATIVGLGLWPVMAIALPASVIGTFVTWRSRPLYRNVCLACAVVCCGFAGAVYLYWESTTGGY